MATSPAPFQYPQFGIQGFPYQNFIDQLTNSPINGPYSNGGQYGRWNGVNNNAFGLATYNHWPSLFGSPSVNPPMQFQPPWGGSGMGYGSNQGPGSTPVPLAGGGPNAQMPPSKVGAQPPPATQQVPPPTTKPPQSTAPYGVNPQQYMANQSLIAGIPAQYRTAAGAEPYLQQQAAHAPGVMSVGQQLGVGSFAPNPGSAGPNMANYSAASNPYTPQQIQQLNASNPALALKAYMLDQQAGGRNQFQQLMGWTPDQLNQWINTYNAGGSGYDPTLSAANLPPPGSG